MKGYDDVYAGRDSHTNGTASSVVQKPACNLSTQVCGTGIGVDVCCIRGRNGP